MNFLRLDSNAAIPSIGLGTWQIGANEMDGAISHAIRAGYRHIDCADNYGNETSVGKALQEAMADGVKREDLWVTSKLWNDAHHPESVRPALEQTLKNLRLDYLDLYLVHWPVAQRKGKRYPRNSGDLISLEELPLIDTWHAMEDCVRRGLIKHIGVSNFSAHKLQQLLAEAQIKPVMNQVETHPYLQQPELLDFCKRHDVYVTAYAPLGSAGRPEETKRDNEPVLLGDPAIKAIAQRHSASPAQILIAWALYRGTALIPKSSNLRHIKENLASENVLLTASDMDVLACLDKQFRYINGSTWTIPGSGYTLENLWDEYRTRSCADAPE